MHALAQINQEIISCQSCARLQEYIQLVAERKRAAYLHQDYWGKPVPGWGDGQAWLWIVGLAPGAHGANRTGRMFTGDRSGDFLYAALNRAGLANQPTSGSREDGLELMGVYISAAARCAPPNNKLQPEELQNCRKFLVTEYESLGNVQVILALGKVAFDAVWKMLGEVGSPLPEPKPAFAHGSAYRSGPRVVMASYHVSQQNTFTGKLTPAMFDTVLKAAILHRRGVL